MNRIRELRKKKQMTQAALGKVLHISQGMISAYENEETPLTAELISQLSEFFEVTSDYLLGRDASAPSAPGSKEAGWNVEYPAGVAMRTVPTPPIYQQPTGLSELDISRIAERVAQMNRDAKTSPILNNREQQLIEDYRLLSTAQKLRVQRLIDVLLDNKFNGD